MVLRFALLCFGALAGPGGWVDPCDEGSELFTDHSDWGDVLRQHVQKGTLGGVETALVDYKVIRENPSKLRSYLRQLCKVDISTLGVEEATALYCNAYNALITAYVVHFSPRNSVLELHSSMPGGSIWKEKLGTVANQKVSLDDIEHGIVRNGLAQQVGVSGRIHTCFVCASLSCPDLLMEPFEGHTLVAQLTSATRSWLSNPTKNPGPDGSGRVQLSKIFKWYAGDFEQAAGSRQAFVQNYTSWNVADNAEITFVGYNWALNEVNGSGQYSSASPRFQRSFGAVVILMLWTFSS